MGILCVALLAAALAGPGSAGPSAGTCASVSDIPQDAARALDAVLDSVVTGTELGAAPGAVLSVEGPGWRYVRAIGVADPDTGTPVDCDMPFQIGSSTKMMTGAVLLQLQEEGRLTLDDPLSVHLPAIAARLPNGDRITLRQLLRHTAGVFSYTDDAPDGTQGVARAGMSDTGALGRAMTPEEMVAFALDHGAPVFAPDVPGAWSYSNTGYVLLGMVIEAVEGLPLGKVYETRIFARLGMTRTFLWNDVPRPSFGLPRSWLMPPYDYETTGWNMSQGWAAGGVISTPGDMHRFIRALAGGALFRSPATLAEMQDTVPSPIPGTVGYGAGLIRIEGDVWGHGGQTLGFIAAVGASARDGISFVSWGNSAGNPVVLLPARITAALRQSGLMAE
jgi:D-alanyl-D-alanine carboxypeptidase